MLVWPKAIAPSSGPFAALYKDMGPEGVLAQFLQDFGKTLRSKYDPRAIVVFSAHWESPSNQILGKCSNKSPISTADRIHFL
jgi:aromatic ring-opening dioxygenase catalytic subunit (LigB family)